ncbi:MAG: tRNA lysidine(34) synthetase TilS [Coriobacteriia bacterium]|nr:tRNA lysidine(34) synthetase TilS [Coriobacteriia bacterium]
MAERTNGGARPGASGDGFALERLAREAVGSGGMLPPGAPVVAMVSGGADSVALLRLLASGTLAPGSPLSVLHVDHMLRPDSAEDAAFVSELCASLGVPVTVARYDVGAYAAAEGLNVEDAGRRVRYRFAEEELDAACRRADVAVERGRVAVAHTLDDRVETVLMRLIAGAGPGALAGIRPVRGRVVRPLLRARRSQVTAYLDSLGQPWREDPTNRDISRTRARVRWEVVPLLAAMNPRFAEAVERTADIVGEEDALLAEMAEAFARDFTETVETRGGAPELRVDRALMTTLTRPIIRRALRAALVEAFPEASRLEAAHLEALVDGVSSEGFARDLPEGLRAFTEYDTMVVCRAGESLPALAPALLDIPGIAELGEAGSISAEEVAPDAPTGGPETATVDADRVSGPLIVDSPREGDRMRPLGMRGTKKLSDILTDAKVPRRRRPVTPVVRDGEAIVWVAGVRLSEEHKVGPETRRALRLTWSGRDRA